MNKKYKHLMKRLYRTADFNELEVIEVEGHWAFRVPSEEGVQHNIYASDEHHDYVFSLKISPREKI